MGWELAIESSSRAATLALGQAGQFTLLRLDTSAAHASDLLPCLDRELFRLGLKPQDLDTIHVGLGPGSYTGLRVGLATAKGLALALGARVRGECSLEVLAFEALAPGEEASVAIDARAGAYYYARYRRLAQELEVVEPLCVLAPQEALARAAQAPRCLDGSLVPTALGLAHLSSLRAPRLGFADAASIEPLYLRPFAVTQRKR